MLECCEAGDDIQSGRRVALRDLSYGEIRVKLPTFIYFHDLKKHIKGEVLTCRDSLALQKEATYGAGRGHRHCSHVRNPCGCWGQGKHLGCGQHLPAARQSLGFRCGAGTAAPSFPCNCRRFGRGRLPCNASVCWLCAWFVSVMEQRDGVIQTVALNSWAVGIESLASDPSHRGSEQAVRALSDVPVLERARWEKAE